MTNPSDKQEELRKFLAVQETETEARKSQAKEDRELFERNRKPAKERTS